MESKPFQPVCYKGTRKKNDEPSDMVRILSEIEKCTSNINFDGWPFDHWNDHRERDTDTSYHKAKKSGPRNKSY